VLSCPSGLARRPARTLASGGRNLMPYGQEEAAP